jgi:hypothetical protein
MIQGITGIHLRDARCFAGSHDVPLAPLTLLVGENSTGKSSFLALLRIGAEIAQGNLSPGFNAEPFLLGAYDQIANYRGGRAGRARNFEVGITLTGTTRVTDRSRDALHCCAVFEKQGAQPVLTDLSWTIGQYSLHLKRSGRRTESVSVRAPGFEEDIVGDTLGRLSSSQYFDTSMLPVLAMRMEEGARDKGKSIDQVQKIFFSIYRTFMPHLGVLSGGVHAFAPVRSRPERTYNPVEESPRSEGSHVPMILAKTFFTERGRWQDIKSALNNFGKASGIFREISVRPLGQSESDPFQIVVKIAGPPSNLIDVGYGVSQILPIVVDLLLNRSSRTYLLQQPEVHLHPRAQAELGSFLAGFVKQTNSRLLVETHSDYIIDRLRSDIRDKKNLSSDDILILFFERQDFDVRIHPINIDKRGNLKRVPQGYRSFFLQEQQLLLGIA